MKNVVLYVLAVGGCVVAIVALLYLGDGISAPMSVSGSWAVEPGAVCDAVPLPKADAALRISQSGPRLEISLDEGGRTVLHGDLEGSHVTAESRHRQGDPARMRLTGDVEKGASGERDRLRGTLEVDGCDAPIAILAVRQPPAAPGKKGH